MNKARVVLMLLFCGSSAVLVRAADTQQSILDEKATATIQAFGVPGASVAVIKNGALFWAKAYGEADIQHQRKAELSTRYAVGSISKQFTAAALLLEQERGKV